MNTKIGHNSKDRKLLLDVRVREPVTKHQVNRQRYVTLPCELLISSFSLDSYFVMKKKNR